MDLKDLLIRVLKGTATLEQREQLEQWLQSLEGNKAERTHLNLQSSPTRDDLTEIRRLVMSSLKIHRKRRLLTIMISSVFFAVIAIMSINYKNNSVFIFQNVTLDHIIPQIESTFGVTISFDPAISKCRFTGEFHRAKSLEEMLSTITSATGLQYRKKNSDHFEITGTSCVSAIE